MQLKSGPGGCFFHLWLIECPREIHHEMFLTLLHDLVALGLQEFDEFGNAARIFFVEFTA